MKTTKEKTPETKPTEAELQTILDGKNEDLKIVKQPDGSIRAEPVETPNPPPTPTLEPETTETQAAETQVAETILAPPKIEASTGEPLKTQASAPPSTNGAMRHFKKIQVQMPMYVDKVRIKFDVLGDNVGVIKLDPHTDSRTIEVLDEFAKAKKGGVVAIDEESFNGLKKKHPFQSSAPRFKPQEKLRVWESKPRRLSPSVSAKGAEVAGNIRHSPVVSGSGGSAGSTDGGAAGAGTPAVFSPNLQRKSASNVLKSGVLKTPASGQFRPGVAPPPFPTKT